MSTKLHGFPACGKAGMRQLHKKEFVHPLQKQFHDVIIKKQLFQKEEKVLLAVSGGLDSMVMAHLFLASEYSFGIAHCNFGLRGIESDGDEKLVCDWASENGVEYHVKHFQLGEGSIQLAARNARYEWFNELLEEHNYHKIATAHHLNDSIETSLLNLSRGTGIKGIGGIQSNSEKVIRPLLFATKDELTAYAKEEAIEWREDDSNTKTEYSRNLIRHKVVPILKELNPSLNETFSNTSERLQLANDLVQLKVEEMKSAHLSKENGLWKLDTSWIQQETDMLLLSDVLSDFGFNYVTVKEINDALGKSGKLFLSELYKLSIDRDCLFISELKKEEGEDLVIAGEGEYLMGVEKLSVTFVSKDEVVFGSNSGVSFFDASKVEFPFKMRDWKKGDRFRPLGMSGSKKVSDYLIDNKVPVASKDQVKVVTSQDSIIWIVKHQISDDCKISDRTKRVLRLEIT